MFKKITFVNVSKKIYFHKKFHIYSYSLQFTVLKNYSLKSKFVNSPSKNILKISFFATIFKISIRKNLFFVLLPKNVPKNPSFLKSF